VTREYYGFSSDEWQSLRTSITDTLVETVSSTGVIPYSVLVATTLSQLHDRPAFHEKTENILKPESQALAAMLDEVSTESCNASPDRGMLSVVVVHKSGDKRPGSGFFQLAKRLRRVGPNDDEEAVWIRELHLVQERYS